MGVSFTDCRCARCGRTFGGPARWDGDTPIAPEYCGRCVAEPDVPPVINRTPPGFRLVGVQSGRLKADKVNLTTLSKPYKSNGSYYSMSRTFRYTLGVVLALENGLLVAAIEPPLPWLWYALGAAAAAVFVAWIKK